MIFTTIIDFLSTIFIFMAGALPLATGADEAKLSTIQEMITKLREFIDWGNFFFPIDELINMIRTFIIIYIAIIGVKLLIKLIRG
jgi:hypothetical protein